MSGWVVVLLLAYTPFMLMLLLMITLMLMLMLACFTRATVYAYCHVYGSCAVDKYHLHLNRHHSFRSNSQSSIIYPLP